MGVFKSTRKSYGEALCEVGQDENIVVLDADLTICTMSCYFAEKYPERFYNAGIAEANMIGMSAGIASTGKTVFCNSFAMFTAGRGYEQIRNSIAYPELNVRVVGTHAGLSVGEDGATHQCIEDLSLMRTIPNMTVICPADSHETQLAVQALVKHNGPSYFRLGRAAVENVTDSIEGYHFEIGKGALLRDGKDVTIIATGIMVQVALEAAKKLESQGIQARIVDMHTIKPIDREIILESARLTGALVTAEEHSVIGGLGSAVSEVVSEEYPVPVIRLGVNDVFGHSGSAEALLVKYGLTSDNLIDKVKLAISKKISQ